MSRTKGSKNKQLASHPELLDMSVEERLEFIVNLIVDQIVSEESKEAYYGK